MSDRDLDLEFEATNKSLRPQSQLARSFADQLNDVFLLDETLDKLDRNINRKKQSVSYQSSELALLEARIKNAEKLLAEKKAHLVQRSDGVAGGAGGGSNGNSHKNSSNNSNNIPDYAPNPNFSATPEAAADQQKKRKKKKDVAVQEEDVEEELAGEMGDGVAGRAGTPKPDEYVVVDRVQEKPQAYQVRPPPPPPTVPATI